MSRTYKWQSENREDQANFLEALVRLFRTLTVPQTPLYLDGLHDYNAPGKVRYSCPVQGLTLQKLFPNLRLFEIRSEWIPHLHRPDAYRGRKQRSLKHLNEHHHLSFIHTTGLFPHDQIRQSVLCVTTDLLR